MSTAILDGSAIRVFKEFSILSRARIGMNLTPVSRL